METLARSQVFYPAVVPDLGGGGFLVFSALKLLGRGSRIEAAIEDARLRDNLPRLGPFPRFEGRGTEVVRRDDVVAYAVSATMAKRIANALNHYFPNERGI
jgi:hypothetical protein